jgi:hypothetical protein
MPKESKKKKNMKNLLNKNNRFTAEEARSYQRYHKKGISGEELTSRFIKDVDNQIESILQYDFDQYIVKVIPADADTERIKQYYTDYGYSVELFKYNKHMPSVTIILIDWQSWEEKAER